VDPFAADGSVLKYIESGPLPPAGSADTKLMPFSYRACLTNNRSNIVPFPQPPGYNPADFELLSRYVASFSAPPGITDLVGLDPYGGPVPYPAGPDRDMKCVRCVSGRRKFA
jgi:hypothetical protein